MTATVAFCTARPIQQSTRRQGRETAANLTGRQLLESDHFNGLSLDHGLLRIAEQVKQGIDALQLVVGDAADGLLAHGALISVARRLVVVRIGNETGDNSKDRHGIDLQVCSFARDVAVAKSDVACTNDAISDGRSSKRN